MDCPSAVMIVHAYAKGLRSKFRGWFDFQVHLYGRMTPSVAKSQQVHFEVCAKTVSVQNFREVCFTVPGVSVSEFTPQ